MTQITENLSEAKTKISEFEHKYGRSFAQFEAEVLPTANDWDTHEDYNDWFFFSVIVERLSSADSIST
ncbi:MAG: hypothetical protein KBG20_17895 [Caldilineaceae bacterium]|nr:hypothetical protein [Caldilineaceae bacterium]MBP8109043.1 hypothetical protein [Caldilineaceae bacterium]MBP8122026.1 hypothetical protein [Caldilineaceae bacterium]MBP9074183.1 hypothetical protein [Caldilineaceae bacterium]